MREFPSRAEVDASRGPLLLEFGADWCGHCQRAQALIAAALADFPGVAHHRIADGKGLPLGRSFHVKLWPTLIFLRDGVEQARAVRPTAVEPLSAALRGIV